MSTIYLLSFVILFVVYAFLDSRKGNHALYDMTDIIYRKLRGKQLSIEKYAFFENALAFFLMFSIAISFGLFIGSLFQT